MTKLKTHLVAALVVLGIAAIVGGIFAKPVWAQVRAALVRDIDAPALAPFRAHVDYSLCCINDQRLVTTVPAGKRLVIEHVSYYSAGQSGDELIFGSLRSGQFGPQRLYFKINPPHVSASASFVIQEDSHSVKAYFEAGEEVWISVSHSTGAARNFQAELSGYYVTP